MGFILICDWDCCKIFSARTKQMKNRQIFFISRTKKMKIVAKNFSAITKRKILAKF
jgi:hypothetical protein